MSNLPYQPRFFSHSSFAFSQGDRDRLMKLPFVDFRAELLSSKYFSALGLRPETDLPKAADVFQEMFLKPLRYWNLPASLLAEKYKKIEPQLQSILDNPDLDAYQKVGKFLEVFKEFREDLPRRSYKSTGWKAGKIYGTRHADLRAAMEDLNQRLLLADLKKMPAGAWFPDGNPWSSILSKIKDKIPEHSKYEGLKMPLDFLFRIGRPVQKDGMGGVNAFPETEWKHRKHKHDILASLSDVERLAISRNLGHFLEPKVCPWLYRETSPPQRYPLTGFVPPKERFYMEEKAHSSARNPFEKDAPPNLRTETSLAQSFFGQKKSTFVAQMKPSEFLSLLEEDQSHLFKPDFPPSILVVYSLLTQDEQTIDRNFVLQLLEGYTPKNCTDPDFLDHWRSSVESISIELNRLRSLHRELNPWSVMDTDASNTLEDLVDGIRRQPLLLLQKPFIVLNEHWRKAAEAAKPGLLSMMQSQVIMITSGLGMDLESMKGTLYKSLTQQAAPKRDTELSLEDHFTLDV